MSTLNVAILGLGRLGASFGLALQRASEEGKYHFDVVGYDERDANRKSAQKMGAVARTVTRAHEAVRDQQIIIMTLGYEDVRTTLRHIAPDLRDGVVILDASPIKQPSITWAEEFLGAEHHLIGITPLVNPKYIFRPMEDAEFAREDMFADATMLITPTPSALKEVVDLAFNLAGLLGSKPRFIDPHDHDTMLAQTNGVPRLAGIALFRALMLRDDWHDLQWLTNPAWAVLTLPLRDYHPDALRDELMLNQENVVRALDDYITQLQAFRDVLAQQDQDALEATLVASAAEYETWLNHRYKADWDDLQTVKVDPSQTIMGTLFGSGITKRFMGRKDND